MEAVDISKKNENVGDGMGECGGPCEVVRKDVKDKAV